MFPMTYQTKPSWWVLMMRSLKWILDKSRMYYINEIWLRSNEGDLMNHDPPTHQILFLSCDVFVNIFLLKKLILIWNTLDYFFIVKW